MHPSIARDSPVRRPQWRLDRVIQLLSNRPLPLHPRRYDDHYVRAYRRILGKLRAAGDDLARQDAVFLEYPDVYQAHRLHYSPDLEHRQILEARLLTNESFDEIASRYSTTPKAIDYYEKLFFHVRDRLKCSSWIHKVISGPRSDYRDNKNKGIMTDDERGYVYRLFAFYGGPLVLDAVITGLSPNSIPRLEKNLAAWFDGTLNQLVRTNAAVGAATLRMDQAKLMQMIKLAVRTSEAAGSRGETPNTVLEERVKELLATIEWTPAGRALAELGESQKEYLKSPVEPRADEQLALAKGVMPSTFEAAIARVDPTRLGSGQRRG